jgi:hypothetical protein
MLRPHRQPRGQARLNAGEGEGCDGHDLDSMRAQVPVTDLMD